MAKVNTLWELQPAMGEELRPLFFAERTLIPSLPATSGRSISRERWKSRNSELVNIKGSENGNKKSFR